MNLEPPQNETPEAKRSRLKKELGDCEDAISTYPKNHNLLLQKGFILNQLGKYKDAIECLKKSIKIEPTVKAYQQLGLAYSEIEEYNKSLKAYENALELDPKNIETHNCKGFILSLLGEHKQAIVEYREILKIDNDNTDARLNLGYSLDELGKHNEAIELYDSIITLNPNDCCAYFNKGYSLSTMGESRRALEAFDKSISIRPDDACTHYFKGCAHYDCLELEDALKEFNTSLTIDKNYAEAFQQKGMVLEQLGRYNEAIDAYSSFLSYCPDDIPTICRRGQLYQKIGNIDAAIVDYQFAINCSPPEDCVQYYIKIIDCQFNSSRYEDAIKTAEQLDECEMPSIFDALHVEKIRGDSYFALKKYTHAFDSYEQYLKIIERMETYNYSNSRRMRLQLQQQKSQLSNDIAVVKERINICLDKIKIPDWLSTPFLPRLVAQENVRWKLSDYIRESKNIKSYKTAINVPKVDSEALLLLNRYGMLYAEELIKKTLEVFGNREINSSQVKSVDKEHYPEIILAIQERVQHYNDKIEKTRDD